MGPLAEKFEGAAAKCVGLTSEFCRMAAEIGCDMFDSGEVVSASAVDGIHLDEEQHFDLGSKLATVVRKILETP